MPTARLPGRAPAAPDVHDRFGCYQDDDTEAFGPARSPITTPTHPGWWLASVALVVAAIGGCSALLPT